MEKTVEQFIKELTTPKKLSNEEAFDVGLRYGAFRERERWASEVEKIDEQ